MHLNCLAYVAIGYSIVYTVHLSIRNVYSTMAAEFTFFFFFYNSNILTFLFHDLKHILNNWLRFFFSIVVFAAAADVESHRCLLAPDS